MRCQVLYSYRLSVRTPGFHPGKRGSIPRSCTNLSQGGSGHQWGLISLSPSLVQIQALQPVFCSALCSLVAQLVVASAC